MKTAQELTVDENAGSPGASPRWRFDAAFVVRVTLSVAVLSTLGVCLFFFGRDFRYYAFLADAFLHGTFSVNNLPASYLDRVTVGGTVYVYLTPLPGILLIPLVSLFGTAFDDIVLAYPATAANILLMLLLLKRIGIAREVRSSLLVLFFCGTVYFSVLANGRSWFLAHILAITFLLLAINEVLSWQRVPLIGLWLGMAFLTRSLTIFALPFFVVLLAPFGQSWFRRIVSVGFQLALGLVIPVAFFLYYNYSRFGNPFETGYGIAQTATTDLAAALKLGLFSVVHVPKNLFVLFLAGPQPYPGFGARALEFPYFYPSPWGMSIFLTTPAFVYAFMADWSERLVRASWLAVGLVLLPMLFFYGIGWVQFGYRYALDFYPFLFILTALGIARHYNRWINKLIIVCVFINLWGALWEVYGFKIFPVL